MAPTETITLPRLCLLGLPRDLAAAARAALSGRSVDVTETDPGSEGRISAGVLLIDPPTLPAGRLRYLEEERRAPFVGLLRADAETILESLDVERPVRLVSASPGLDATAFRMTVERLLGPVAAGGAASSGLRPYFPGGARAVEIGVGPSIRKHAFLDAAREFLAREGTATRLTDDVLAVTEELVLNALKAAPAGPGLLARSRGAAPPRISLMLALDGERAGVQVTDPFGALDPTRALRSLIRCFHRGPDQIERKPLGAGLGIYSVYLASCLLSLTVEKGVRTEALALVPRRPGSLRVRSLIVAAETAGS